LPDCDESRHGVHIIGTKCASLRVSFEEGPRHCLDPLDGALSNCKGPRKDGQIVGAIAPAAAVEVIERESTILLAGISSMKIAMAKTKLEIGHSPYPLSQSITQSVDVGDVLGTVSNRGCEKLQGSIQ